MGKILKYDDNKLQIVLNQFNIFYEYSWDLLSNGDLLYKSNLEFWIAAARSTSMRELSDIVSIFLSLPASQSTCERIISVKRSAVSKQQYRMKNDILTARAPFRAKKIVLK